MNEKTELATVDDASDAAALPAVFEEADEHASDYAFNDIGLALRVQALAREF